MDLQWIAAPLVGGVIGYVTNSLAIKMLFRPLKPVYLWGHKLPFTPGMIPKEQPRIAAAIGKVVGRELLDGETLQKALCGEKIEKTIRERVEELMNHAAESQETMGDFLGRQGLRTGADKLEESMADKLSHYAAQKLAEQDVGDKLIDYAMEEVVENLNPMVKMIAVPALENSREGLAERINAMVAEMTPDILEGYISSTYEDWLDVPISRAGEMLCRHREEILTKVWNVYVRTMQEKAPQMVESLDLEGIVRNKIQEFSPAELERMIFEICRKELRAVIWLGGFLGMLMGFVNILF